jgi:signal transduction histidine kinase
LALRFHSTPPFAGTEKWSLEIAVSDTGPGLQPEEMRKLFRSELGLLLCRQIVDLMGGTIAVESVPGTGSIFRVSIPQEVQDANPVLTV